MIFRWQFDTQTQILRSPGGYTISVKEIARSLSDQVAGRVDLHGPWSGWKIRGRVMKGPNGQMLTPEFLKKFGLSQGETAE
jgi:hypothetical protein